MIGVLDPNITCRTLRSIGAPPPARGGELRVRPAMPHKPHTRPFSLTRWPPRQAGASGVTSTLGPMAAAIRRSPLASFLALAYAFSWAWMLPLVGAGDVVEKGVAWPTHFPALLGPAVAALVVTTVLWGRAGVRDLLARMAHWRIPLRWWAATLSPLAFRRQRDDSGGHERLRLRPSVAARRAGVARAQAWRSIDPRPSPQRRAGVGASCLVDTVSSRRVSLLEGAPSSRAAKCPGSRARGGRR